MSKTYIWCFSAGTDQLTHKLILNIILQIYRSTTADIYIYIYCYHCGSVSFIKFSRIVVIVCFFFLLLFVVPVVSGWAGLCSRGLQDRLLRTMAAISSSMSTSSGLLWLQDGRVSLLEDMRSCDRTYWSTVRTSDLLGTSMQEETDLLQEEDEEEGWDEGQAETSLCTRSSWSTTPEGSPAPPHWKYTWEREDNHGSLW